MNKGKEIKAILFDLDGTLLPLDQTYFIKRYFKGLAAYGATRGIDPEQLIDGTMAGTEAMLHNDGSMTNKEAFWEAYFEFVGKRDEQLEAICDEFYVGGFKSLREFTYENALATKMIEAAHNGGRKVVLATNPVFPMMAQLERMSWIGLSAEGFDHITSYDNSNYCKPSAL